MGVEGVGDGVCESVGVGEGDIDADIVGDPEVVGMLDGEAGSAGDTDTGGVVVVDGSARTDTSPPPQPANSATGNIRGRMRIGIVGRLSVCLANRQYAGAA